jgi:hypothetical protein
LTSNVVAANTVFLTGKAAIAQEHIVLWAGTLNCRPKPIQSP